MIPFAEPNLGGNEARYLQACVETNFVSSIGPFVDRFEALVAAAAGTPEAVATSSGTAGLHVALAALGVGPDDLVVLPDYTFIGSANAIVMAGASPWLVDISPESWTLGADALREAFAGISANGRGAIHRRSGKRIAAIIAVHALGHPADLDALRHVVEPYGVPIIADGAAALGAMYKGRPIGVAGADLTVFSFNGNKTVTAGGGVAVVGTDARLLETVRRLSTTARSGVAYEHDSVAFNCRMTNLQAAVGCAQMEQLDAFVAAKRRIHQRYAEASSDLEGASPLPAAAWAESACWISGVRLDPARYDRAAVVERLRRSEVDARAFWQPIHQQKPYRDAPRENTAVADLAATRFLALPSSTSLTKADQDRVIAALERALG